MKNVLLTALIAALLASPLMAHSGPHLHPHSSEPLIVGLAALLVSAIAGFAMKARK